MILLFEEKIFGPLGFLPICLELNQVSYLGQSAKSLSVQSTGALEAHRHRCLKTLAEVLYVQFQNRESPNDVHSLDDFYLKNKSEILY